MELKDRFLGAMLGSGIGDALGASTEFHSEYEIPIKHGGRVKDYIHNRWFQLGEVTDDSKMMLCIAKSLINSKGVNLKEICDNFIDFLPHFVWIHNFFPFFFSKNFIFYCAGSFFCQNFIFVM